MWLSTADNNTTDPDGMSPANWVPLMPVKALPPACIIGTNDTNFVTPLGLRGAIDHGPITGVSLGTNGYYPMPGGLVMQWGRHTMPANATDTISFPEPFPTACFIVADASGQLLGPITIITGSISTTTFQADNTGGGIGVLLWFALGK